MKLFDFQCLDCNEKNEYLVDGSEHPACKSCGSPKTEKRYFNHFSVRTHGFRKADLKGQRVRDMIQSDLNSEKSKVKWH